MYAIPKAALSILLVAAGDGFVISPGVKDFDEEFHRCLR